MRRGVPSKARNNPKNAATAATPAGGDRVPSRGVGPPPGSAEKHALSLHRRVAWQVLRLTKRFGREHDGQILLDLHLSQGDLAALTGGSRQRVNDVLGRMQSEGLLQVGPARLTVRDADGLRALAEGRRSLTI